MRARLFARYGPEAGLEVEFDREATIGRGGENSVPLGSRDVSQRHARVYFDDDSTAFWVEDLGSLNGTRVDGEPLEGRRRLAGLSVLGFGATSELFFLELDLEPGGPRADAEDDGGRRTRVDAEAPTLPPGLERPAAREGTRVDRDVPTLPIGLRAGPAAEAPPEPAAEEASPEPAAAAEEAPVAFLLEVTGRAGGRFELRQGDNTIGRSGRARIVLRHREISRRHATLRVDGGRVWLRDEGSRNQTFVGDERVEGEVEIRPGAEIRFGRLPARLTAAAGGPAEDH